METLLDLNPADLRRMTDDESRGMIAICLRRELNDPVEFTLDHPPHEIFEDKEGLGPMPFPLAVLVKRLQRVGGVYSPAVVLWASLFCTTPGCSVMWAYALWLTHKNSGPVTLETLTMGPFSYGVPTIEALHRVWDSQKNVNSPLGNLLDDPATWDMTSGDFMKEAAV